MEPHPPTHDIQDMHHNHELRSEKVRNIIGPMPPALIRYGITVICLALVIVLSVSAFLPYRNRVSGIVYVSDILVTHGDTLSVKARLEFTQSHATIDLRQHSILLKSPGSETKGIVWSYNPEIQTYSEYNTELMLEKGVLDRFTNRQAEFWIVLSETSVLNRLLEVVRLKEKTDK